MTSPESHARSPGTDTLQSPVQPFHDESHRLSDTVDKLTDKFFEPRRTQQSRMTQVTPSKKAEDLNQWADQARKTLSTDKKETAKDKEEIPKIISKLKSEKEISLENTLEETNKQKEELIIQIESLNQQITTLNNKLRTAEASPKRGAAS